MDLSSHPGLRPIVRASLPHFSISARRNAPNSVLLLPTGSAPCPDSCFTTSGARSTLIDSAFKRFKISLGVATGAIRPYQPLAWYPGSPDSAIVGRSGSRLERRAPVTASALTQPALSACSPARVVSYLRSTSPASDAPRLVAPPL